LKDQITVSEIFGVTIQGEGPLLGVPTVFVRTGGCEFRCIWCDSMHAVDPSNRHDWEKLSADDVLERVVDITRGFPCLVTLSGGNPALMSLGGLIERGHELGYSFALETQGSTERDWFAALDHLVLSPKGPSSGMKFEKKTLQRCVEAAGSQTEIALKLIVFGEEDYLFARGVHEDFGELPMYLQAGSPVPSVKIATRPPVGGVAEAYTTIFNRLDKAELREEIAQRTIWLAGRVAQDRWFDVRVGCQLHTMLWGHERGV
jgi:7-carboxy-7-deazaguanine synthase